LDLKNRVALITGGGRGIGKETAILLARQGAKVAVFSNDKTEVEETAAYITGLGIPSIALYGDIRIDADVNRAIQETEAALGPIDILINNAGVMSLKPFMETSTEDWDAIQDVNVRGLYLFTRGVVPKMAQKKEGIIVNISSIWGTKGGPNRSAYITSKYAVIGMTKALGEEFKPLNIRVNAVCPGPVDTKMMDDLAPNVDKSSWLHPEDIAEVIVDLCLPKMKAITGTAIEAFGFGRPVQV
jgi:NAD(P)-dependent dehydrogenase (short-subunit alcohol dehydrogenase family)